MRVLFSILFFCLSARAAERLPNIIFIVADDMGYADMSCQGARFKTPNLDRLASEGTRFTSFYVAQAVCTASRAALLTGCYPNRVGLQGALNHTSRNGIHEDEWLLPEMLKARGYSTAGMGKWHLGTRAKFNPVRNGFDEWLGIPYSNDNSKFHPSMAKEMPPLPLYDGEKVIETDPDQSQFTKRFTDQAVSFIERNSERPFFLYVAHVMPHVPIFVSEKFKGKSGVGLYSDVMQELDWSVGQILSALKKHRLDENTLVVFISDNGPFLSYGDHAGSAKPLREGKLTAFEGGVRVPCIARWTGKIPRRLSSEPFMAIDWMPTIAELVDGKAAAKKIDGRSIRGLLMGDAGAKSPQEAYYFYSGTELQAIRSGSWKLHFAHPFLTVMAEPGRDGKPSGWGNLAPKSMELSGVEGIASRHGYRVEQLELSLFNLEVDVAETNNVAKKNPEIVRRLSKLGAAMRKELGDSLQKTTGTAVREVGLDAQP